MSNTIPMSPEQLDRLETLAQSEDQQVLLDMLRAKFLFGIENSNYEQTEHREHCYRMLKCVDAMRNVLKTLNVDAKMAEYAAEAAAERARQNEVSEKIRTMSVNRNVERQLV